MTAPADSAVVVFARLPRPGLVKTRLAAGVGPEAAARFYQHCAEAAIAQLGRWGGAAPAAAPPPRCHAGLPHAPVLDLFLPHFIRLASRLLGVPIYLFFSRGEDEADVAAWLAPLGVVRLPSPLNAAAAPEHMQTPPT